MSTTPDAPYRMEGQARLASIESDVRRLLVEVTTIGGDDGDGGNIRVLDDKIRDLARDLDAIRAGRARVTAFFLGLALAVAAAIYWAGSTTATVDARLTHVEQAINRNHYPGATP